MTCNTQSICTPLKSATYCSGELLVGEDFLWGQGLCEKLVYKFETSLQPGWTWTCVSAMVLYKCSKPTNCQMCKVLLKHAKTVSKQKKTRKKLPCSYSCFSHTMDKHLSKNITWTRHDELAGCKSFPTTMCYALVPSLSQSMAYHHGMGSQLEGDLLGDASVNSTICQSIQHHIHLSVWYTV